MLARSNRRRRSLAVIAAGGIIAAGSVSLLGPSAATASSHREAPMILGQPQYDNTDLYAFNSPDRAGSVTLVANWDPFEDPAGGPNFFPWATDAQFDINIDNNGDAKADITYRWKFHNAKTPRPGDSFTGNGTFLYNNGKVTSLNDPNLLFRQTYTLYRIDAAGTHTILRNAPVAPSYVGAASMGTPAEYKANLRDAAVVTSGGLKSFAGQADDPFFLDLRVFDLLYGGNLSEVGIDHLAGFNVNALALQVPAADLTKGHDPVIGVWTTTQRRNSHGGYTQVSRLGNPLVNEVVIPYQKKDRFNGSKPQSDGQFLPFVQKSELAATVQAVYGIPKPAEPRTDLVSVFLTGVPGLNQPAQVIAPGEELRLNTVPFANQTYDRLGVIAGDNNGFPNGRRLADDVLDSAVQVVEGKLIPGHPAIVDSLGDGVNTNDVAFGSSFPYVALPHSGSDAKGVAAANSNAAQHATFLTGGDVSSSSGSGIPVLPISGALLGALVLMAGVYGLRNAGPRGVGATA